MEPVGALLGLPDPDPQPATVCPAYARRASISWAACRVDPGFQRQTVGRGGNTVHGVGSRPGRPGPVGTMGAATAQRRRPAAAGGSAARCAVCCGPVRLLQVRQQSVREAACTHVMEAGGQGSKQAARVRSRHRRAAEQCRAARQGRRTITGWLLRRRVRLPHGRAIVRPPGRPSGRNGGEAPPPGGPGSACGHPESAASVNTGAGSHAGPGGDAEGTRRGRGGNRVAFAGPSARVEGETRQQRSGGRHWPRGCVCARGAPRGARGGGAGPTNGCGAARGGCGAWQSPGRCQCSDTRHAANKVHYALLHQKSIMHRSICLQIPLHTLQGARRGGP